MTFVKYNPFTTLKTGTFDSLVNELSGRTLSDFFDSDFTSSTPSVNIIEKEDSFILEVAAPGLKKEDFSVTIEENHLTISAKKTDLSDKSEKEDFTKREFNFSSFKRRFHLSDKISREDISAKYEKGILSISLLKTFEEKGTRKSIEIV